MVGSALGAVCAISGDFFAFFDFLREILAEGGSFCYIPNQPN